MLEFFLKVAYQIEKQDQPEKDKEEVKFEIDIKIKSEIEIFVIFSSYQILKLPLIIPTKG